MAKNKKVVVKKAEKKVVAKEKKPRELSEQVIKHLSEYGARVGRKIVVRVEKESKGDEKLLAKGIEILMEGLDGQLEKA